MILNGLSVTDKLMTRAIIESNKIKKKTSQPLDKAF